MNGQFTFPVLATALFLGGCDKPRSDEALRHREATPAASSIDSHRLPDSEVTKIQEPRVSAQPPSAESAEPAQAAQEAVVLIAEFDAKRDETRRGEIVAELAINGSPTARRALDRIYRGATEVERKVEVITALGTIDSEEFEPSLVLLQDAVAARQPRELREAAIGAMQDLASPRMLSVWQTLLGDPDAEFRDTARVMVEEYTRLQ